MKPSTHTYFLGVDVCKANLDVFDPRTGKARRFPNTPKGLCALFAALAKPAGQPHLVCEPSGGYEKALLKQAHERRIPISPINPRQVRDFARAKGQLAKTDAIDARILSEYGHAFQPEAQRPPSPSQEALSAVVRRKEVLVRQMVREKNALEKASDRFVLADIKAAIRQLEKRIAKCEARVLELIDSDPELRCKRDRITQVKGLGDTVAAVLLAELPELGSISNKQASCLVGLAPLNRDSGQWRGHRSIHGGRSLVRRNLYMPALCAATHNPILRSFYRGLITRKKPHHLALVAVMRKIVCLANRILSDPDYQPADTA